MNPTTAPAKKSTIKFKPGLWASMKDEQAKFGRSIQRIIERMAWFYYKGNGPKAEIDTSSEIRPRRARGKK